MLLELKVFMHPTETFPKFYLADFYLPFRFSLASLPPRRLPWLSGNLESFLVSSSLSGLLPWSPKWLCALVVTVRLFIRKGLHYYLTKHTHKYRPISRAISFAPCILKSTFKFYLFRQVLDIHSWLWAHYVTEANLELLTVGNISVQSAGDQTRALCMLGKHCTVGVTSPGLQTVHLQKSWWEPECLQLVGSNVWYQLWEVSYIQIF